MKRHHFGVKVYIKTDTAMSSIRAAARNIFQEQLIFSKSFNDRGGMPPFIRFEFQMEAETKGKAIDKFLNFLSMHGVYPVTIELYWVYTPEDGSIL